MNFRYAFTAAVLTALALSIPASEGYLRGTHVAPNFSMQPMSRIVYSVSFNPSLRTSKLFSSLEKVMDLTAESLGIDRSSIMPTSHFGNDLQADSLKTLELVMTLEDNFGVKIDDAQAAEISNPQQAADYIDAALKAKSGVDGQPVEQSETSKTA